MYAKRAKSRAIMAARARTHARTHSRTRTVTYTRRHTHIHAHTRSYTDDRQYGVGYHPFAALYQYTCKPNMYAGAHEYVSWCALCEHAARYADTRTRVWETRGATTHDLLFIDVFNSPTDGDCDTHVPVQHCPSCGVERGDMHAYTLKRMHHPQVNP